MHHDRPRFGRRTHDNERMATEHDEVDRIVGAWVTQRPDLDFSPLEVLSRVDYVASRGGGRGAVREVCDLIIRAQDKWDAAMAEYLA